METTFIYALKDPRDGRVRYIGKADRPGARLRQHIFQAKSRRTHKDCWISGIRNSGLRPVLEILDEVPTTQWEFWEREYIRVFKAIGISLVNLTEGGDALPILTGPNHPAFGKPHSPEWRKKISAGVKRSWEEGRKKNG